VLEISALTNNMYTTLQSCDGEKKCNTYLGIIKAQYLLVGALDSMVDLLDVKIDDKQKILLAISTQYLDKYYTDYITVVLNG